LSTPEICVIVPTLNEGPTIRSVILEAPLEIRGKGVRIVVIDGGSTDGTVEKARQSEAQVLLQHGTGKGAAMKEAANAIGAEVYVFIDGDGTYSSAEMERLVVPILDDEADMVIGSRMHGHAESGAIGLLNRIGNRMFNLMTRRTLHVNLKDMLSGYRAIRGRAFKELVLFSDGFEIESEITIESTVRRFRIKEVDVSYKKRVGSASKLRAFRDGGRIARTLFFIVMNARPFFFFSIFASIFFVVGLYPASLVLYEKIYLGEVVHIPSVVLASFLFIAGALVLIVGLLADLVVNTRRRIEYELRKVA